METCNSLLDAIAHAREVMGQRASPRVNRGESPPRDANRDDEDDTSATLPRVQELKLELDRTRKASKRRIGGIKQELAQLQHHHAEHEEKMARLSDAYTAAQEQSRSLHDQLSAVLRERDTLSAELSALQSRDIAEELRVLHESVAVLKESNRDKEGKLAVAELKMAELQVLAFASCGDDRLALLRQQVHELTGEVVSRDKLLEAKEALLSDVKARLQSVTDEKYALLGRLDETSTAADNAQSEVAALRNAIQAKERVIAETRAALRASQNENTECLLLRDQDEAQALAREDALRQVVAQLQRDVEAARCEVQARDNHTNAIQRQLEQFISEAADMHSQRIIESERSNKTKNILAHQLRINGSQLRARAFFADWVRLTIYHRHTRHTDSVTAWQSRVSLLESAAVSNKEAADAAWSSLVSAHRQEVEAHHGAMQELKEQHAAALRDMKIRHERELRDVESETDVLLARVRTLETQSGRTAAQAATELEAKTKEVETLRHSLIDLEKSRDSSAAQSDDLLRLKSAELRDLQLQVSLLHTERANLSRTMALELAQRDDQIVKREFALKAERDAKATVARELEAANARTQRLQSENRLLEEHCKRLEQSRNGEEVAQTAVRSVDELKVAAQLEEAQRQVDVLQQQVVQERAKVVEITAQLDAATSESTSLRRELVTAVRVAPFAAPGPSPVAPPPPLPLPQEQRTPQRTPQPPEQQPSPAQHVLPDAVIEELQNLRAEAQYLRAELRSRELARAEDDEQAVIIASLITSNATLTTRLEESEAKRQAEATALLELASGLEASHTEEVGSLLKSVAAAQNRIASVARDTQTDKEAARQQQARIQRLRVRGCAALQRRAILLHLTSRFRHWERYAAARRIAALKSHASSTVSQLQQTCSKLRAVAESAVAENNAMRTKVFALESLRDGAAQTEPDTEVIDLKKRLDDNAERSRSTGQVMSAARDQLTQMVAELRDAKQREKQLLDRVKTLSAALEQEAALAKNLKQEFLALLASGGESNALHSHVHPHAAVPSRK